MDPDPQHSTLRPVFLLTKINEVGGGVRRLRVFGTESNSSYSNLELKTQHSPVTVPIYFILGRQGTKY